MPRPQKEERLHIRVTINQKNIITRAAELKGITMTEFMLGAAFEAATHLILDQTDRQVPADKWAAIEAALAAPAQEISALREMARKYGHLVESKPELATTPDAKVASSPKEVVVDSNPVPYASESSWMPLTGHKTQSRDACFASAESTTVKQKELAVA